MYHDIVGIRAGVAARPASVVAFPPGVKRVHVPALIEHLFECWFGSCFREGDAKTETMSDETAERMARTRFIVDEYTMGVLDEQEAGERLFRHLFPHWG